MKSSHAPQLNVYALPRDVPAEDLANSTVVVIDLLRASTTICCALAAGARYVVPFVEVADAEKTAYKLRAEGKSSLLAGERDCVRIRGFDIGNSPLEYNADRVAGRRLLFSTTNGTKALEHARHAKRVVIGAAVNLSAVARAIKGHSCVNILCAGTNGQRSREDELTAGALTFRLLKAFGADQSGIGLLDVAWRLNPMATEAYEMWIKVMRTAKAFGRSPSEQLALELRETEGGRNLLAVRHGEDLIACAQIDSLDEVPRLDVARWRITLS